MPDIPEDVRKPGASGDTGREPSALKYLVQRLKSQPLLFGLGVMLVLANVATASIASLRVLLPAAVAIVVVAVTAWTVVELVRSRRAPTANGEQVRMTTRRVGRTGEVVGIDDESGLPATGGTSVDLKATDVTGRVTGVRHGPRRP